MRKGLPPIYPANPGAIVVSVDAGHGGRYGGALDFGYREKDLNLDIGLKLRDLLQHAGVQVAMSRTADVRLNEPPGYQLIDAPQGSVSAGSNIGYRFRVTNRGNVASSGWRLVLGSVPAVPVYDGSGNPGMTIGSAAVPDGLAPGESVTVNVAAVAPAGAGSWLVKSDIQLGNGSRLSTIGVVPLQVPLVTND